jgi:hypothetical protein
MKRFQSVSSIKLNTIGRAALLNMRFTDGSSQAIEIECDKVGELMSAVLRTCAMLGKTVEGTVAESSPDDAIAIPTLEIGVRGNGNGGAWLLFRVGAQDFGVLLPEQESRLRIASLLQDPASGTPVAPPLEVPDSGPRSSLRG